MSFRRTTYSLDIQTVVAGSNKHKIAVKLRGGSCSWFCLDLGCLFNHLRDTSRTIKTAQNCGAAVFLLLCLSLGRIPLTIRKISYNYSIWPGHMLSRVPWLSTLGLIGRAPLPVDLLTKAIYLDNMIHS